MKFRGFRKAKEKLNHSYSIVGSLPNFFFPLSFYPSPPSEFNCPETGRIKMSSRIRKFANRSKYSSLKFDVVDTFSFFLYTFLLFRNTFTEYFHHSSGETWSVIIIIIEKNELKKKKKQKSMRWMGTNPA